jgi:hypothetical protein
MPFTVLNWVQLFMVQTCIRLDCAWLVGYAGLAIVTSSCV